MRDKILEDLTEIFEDVLDVDDVELSDDTTAEDIEEWDSLSNIRLVVAIENHFSVKFSNAEIESMQKLGDVIDMIEKKRA